MIRRVCIQWPRFGRYHLARLEACEHLFSQHGIELIALETASSDALYAWEIEDGPVLFRREQIFPGRTFEEVSPREMERGMLDTLNRLQPDAVAIMSYGFPDARAALAWCRMNRRVAVDMTDSKADDAPRVAWREWIKRRIVGMFDAALVGGTPQRDYLEALGMSGHLIVEGSNVVDNASYAATAADVRRDPSRWGHLPGWEDDRPAFISINRFLELKNLDGLVHAYQTYRRRVSSPWRLILVGDGPDRARIEQLVAEKGVDGVTFAGFRQADEVAAYLGRAHALVHPSHKDTWGLVVNEAMAAGLPVIVSRQSGCWKNLVDEGENGFTFVSTDLDALADHMTVVAAPETDRDVMGARSREIVAQYTPGFFAEQLLKAIRLGTPGADRAPDRLALALLWWLRMTSPSVTAHHSTQI